MLVRRNRLERKDRDADQRVVLGDNGDGCENQSGSDYAHRWRIPHGITLCQFKEACAEFLQETTGYGPRLNSQDRQKSGPRSDACARGGRAT